VFLKCVKVCMSWNKGNNHNNKHGATINNNNLTHLITLYSCNRNVTLKTVGLPAEYVREYITIKIHQWNKVHFVGF